ncbi:hypothetical protein MUN82_06390 [Hymenobacter aerilatus]|uniref:Replication protein n=1 Tax=Hymenobacter aerilatus TaxID=2932251 RepID=A0A8T9T166_9BACT|nr:hypothetical protein [Hymenobacter aerilatus]UOR06723.1 hypothetical protein MUN82_06390 [Hymenobacter aerilatus]
MGIPARRGHPATFYTFRPKPTVPLQVSLLPLGACLLRWHQKIDALWHSTPRIQITRTITKGVRAGVEETIVRRGARLVVDGAKATGEVLLKWYRKRVERMLYSSFLFDTLVTDEGVMMPSILVDARLLMQQRSLTERTMRNHLAQLLKIGFILRKKWHGRKRQFELWINPEFVIQTDKKAVEKPVEADSGVCPIGEIISTNGIKFPPRELPELQKDRKSEIGQCAEIVTPDLSEKPFQEAEGRNPAAGVVQTAKSEAGAGGAAAAVPALPAAEDPAQAEKQAKYSAYVVSAWLLAKALLYPEHHFTPHQEQLALAAIRTGVYRDFQDPNFDFARYHQGVLRRLELVEKHFQKHAGRYYAPMPWAEIVKGRGYFDWENEKGFRGTMKWLLADQRAEHLAKVNRTIRQALGQLKLRRKLDRGEKTTRKPAKHILATTLTTLYQHHAQAIEQLGGLPALNKFNLQVQTLLKRK